MNKLILSLILLFIPHFLLAQKVNVDAPREVSTQDEYFKIVYELEGAGSSSYQAPDFKGFRVLSGPNVASSNSYSNINGKQYHQQIERYTYLLKAEKKGTYTLPPFVFIVGNRSVKSRTITIVVNDKPTAKSNAAGSIDDDNTPQQIAGTPIGPNDLSIKTKLSKENVYAQDAVTLTYLLYCKPGIPVQNIAMTKKPDFKDIISQTIQQNSVTEGHLEKIGKQFYKVYPIKQFILFPKSSGTITIPSIQFECTVVQKTAFNNQLEDFFNGGGLVGKKVTRNSPSINFNVKPLPQPYPPYFTGGVGHFSISSQLITPTPKTNELGTFRIVVKGKGNLKLLSPPQVNFPSNIEHYAPQITDKTQEDNGNTMGEVWYDYTFVPHEVGQLTLPDVKMDFFNPEKEAYETISTQKIILQIAKGKHNREDVEKLLSLKNSDIYPQKNGANVTSSFYITGVIYYLLLLLCLLGGPLLLYLLRYIRHHLIQRSTSQHKIAAKAVSALETMAKAPTKDTFRDTQQVFLDYLTRANKLSESFRRQEHLKDLNYTDVQKNKIEKFIERCNYLCYAPNNHQDKKEVIHEAIELIQELEQTSLH